MPTNVGEIYTGKVTGLTSFGAFIRLSNGDSGMVHISEVAQVYVKDINEFLSEGQEVNVKVLSIVDNKISLSIKQTLPKPAPAEKKFEKKPGFTPERKPSPHKQGGADGGKFKAPPQRYVETKSSDLSFEEMMAKFKQVSDEKMSDLKRASDTGSRGRRSNNR